MGTNPSVWIVFYW